MYAVSANSPFLLYVFNLKLTSDEGCPELAGISDLGKRQENSGIFWTKDWCFPSAIARSTPERFRIQYWE